MSENTTTGRRPTHKACFLDQYKDKNGEDKTRFVEICAIWESDKENLMINIPRGMSLSGKIIIMPIKDKDSYTAPKQDGEDEDLPF